MSKPVLIGECPSKGGDRFHAWPLSGPPARTLCKMAGIPPVEGGTLYGQWTWALYEEFECLNLFRRYGEASPWSAPDARRRAALLAGDLSGRIVVLLGRRVQAALWSVLVPDLPPPPFYVWRFEVPGEPFAWTTIHHPSGLNRALNRPLERQACGETLRRAVELAA